LCIRPKNSALGVKIDLFPDPFVRLRTGSSLERKYKCSHTKSMLRFIFSLCLDLGKNL
jgi:hypothetical protein